MEPIDTMARLADAAERLRQVRGAQREFLDRWARQSARNLARSMVAAACSRAADSAGIAGVPDSGWKMLDE